MFKNVYLIQKPSFKQGIINAVLTSTIYNLKDTWNVCKTQVISNKKNNDDAN